MNESPTNHGEMQLTYRGTVFPWHLDHMNHMNVMHYVGKFDEATWNLFSTFGLTASLLREAGRAMAAVDQQLTYARELHAGDVVSIYSSVLELKEKSIRFRHEMHHGESGTVAATCVIKAVHIDSTARKSVAFPEAMLARARKLVMPAPS